MGEVKRYCLSEFAVPHSYPIEPGVYVSEDDYATLEAELATVKKVAYGNMELLEENAKLRAELEQRVPDGCLIVPIQPTEEMRKSAQDYLAAEGMIVSDWLVHTVYTEILSAIPSAPKADDPVKQMLLKALESAADALARAEFFEQADNARAAISAVREEVMK